MRTVHLDNIDESSLACVPPHEQLVREASEAHIDKDRFRKLIAIVSNHGGDISERFEIVSKNGDHFIADPLLCATLTGNTTMIMALIEAGADIDLLFKFALTWDRKDALDICLAADGSQRLLNPDMINAVEQMVEEGSSIRGPKRDAVLNRMKYLQENPEHIPTATSLAASAFPSFAPEIRAKAREHIPATRELSGFSIEGCLANGAKLKI